MRIILPAEALLATCLLIVPVCPVQASTVLPPTIAEAFNPSSILPGGASFLTFTITNPAANGSTNSLGVAFSDVIPTGISPAFNSVSTVCGGTGSVTGQTVSLTGATVATTCVFDVVVIGNMLGFFTDTTGAVSSVNGATGNFATASIDVVSSITPIPGALSLFAAGLSVIGLLAWLRSRAASWVPDRGTVGSHLTKAGTTIRTDFFHQILPPAALIFGLVLTIVWISFLAYQIGRLFESVSPPASAA